MITWQDLQEIIDTGNEQQLIQFIYATISTHKVSDGYKTAKTAEEYHAQRNTTIMQYKKLLYTLSGEAVPDNYSANHKLCSNFFYRFTTQENQYLLGNGVTWNEDSTKDALGVEFDTELQDCGREALIAGVAFGFWNYDHMDVFKLTEFCPLFDEENGALKAGIRFWQIDDAKPLRATLYELDGYTDYIWNKRDERGNAQGIVLHIKRPYILSIRTSEIDGEEIYDGENYPAFPIVPLYANEHKQSELVGMREDIDAYDLIRSGFANDLDDVSQIYWILQNAGGMDEIDLAKFLQQIHRVKAAVVEDDGAKAEAHTMDVPYASREALLTRLRSDMYEDYMALDTKNLADGAVTATQIKTAYEPLNSKADGYEAQVRKFLQGILYLVGIDDMPSFSRSSIVNSQEEIQLVLQAANYLSDRYITEKVLTLLGDIDQLDDVLEEIDESEMDRFSEDESLLEEDTGLLEDEEMLLEDEEDETEDETDVQDIIDMLENLLKEL